MRECFGRLRNHWLAHRTRPASILANQREIAEWEERYTVRLPDDLREYVLKLNGIHLGETLEMDSNGYSFLPLSAMQPESEWGGRNEPCNMFVIADVLMKCYWYCVRLDNAVHSTTQVFLGGATAQENHRAIADSLTEFFELYMMDSPTLHPSTPASQHP
jgi:hypothetical protein